MRLILFSTVLLISITTFSQQAFTFPVIKEDNTLNWKGIEKKVPKTTVDKFIKATPKNFQPYKLKDPDAFLNIDSLRNDLHFVDLNGDGNEDVVFYGQGGGESRETRIFLNTGQNY